MALYGRHPASLGWEPKPKSSKTGASRTHAGRAARNAPLCCSCNRPIRAGDPHWAGHGDHSPWHYACAERAGLTWSWTVRPAVPPLPTAEMD
ncbi:hypothetical protein JHL17_16215 [Azospirillum sp. YIM B02556]|uniref:Uncharacterized protein n=1 Tax=Azospirillum endophyticum TaxID=2800326 RepID=A0ABS1F6D8_9PROT|nr:hypothetical protein [Azospirillum endophyticum]MBK1838962.1 hypothetical protein [Azospirillum endophyticum]